MPAWIHGNGRPPFEQVESVARGDASLIDIARQAQRMRATVAQAFPSGMLIDATWDILIELFITDQEARTVCVKELILTSGETSTSALRRIDRLEAAGIVVRRRDEDDHRRVMIELTPKGGQAMESLLRSMIVDRA